MSGINRKSNRNKQGTLREIFDEEVNQSEVGGYISFPRLENSMFKRRRMHRPQVPLNAQNAISLLETCDEEYKVYHAFSIEGMDQSEVAIGFMGPRWITTFQTDANESLVQADATFYVVPRQFYQLLNIFLQYKTYSLPAIHILMTKKTGTLYDKVMMKVREILPFTATGIITDYETALFNSLSQSYPNVRMSGCKFHHDQAVYKTGILKNGLSNLYTSNQEFRKWAELLLSLPLLPSNKIVDMYHHLKHEKPILSQLDNEKLEKLLLYYEKYWLKQIGASRLSVYQNAKRTNNDLESFHSTLKKRFRLHNPNFWEFVKNLNKIITSNDKDMERIDNNVAIRHNPRPIVLQKELIIAELQRNYHKEK